MKILQLQIVLIVSMASCLSIADVSERQIRQTANSLSSAQIQAKIEQMQQLRRRSAAISNDRSYPSDQRARHAAAAHEYDDAIRAYQRALAMKRTGRKLEHGEVENQTSHSDKPESLINVLQQLQEHLQSRDVQQRRTEWSQIGEQLKQAGVKNLQMPEEIGNSSILDNRSTTIERIREPKPNSLSSRFVRWDSTRKGYFFDDGRPAPYIKHRSADGMEWEGIPAELFDPNDETVAWDPERQGFYSSDGDPAPTTRKSMKLERSPNTIVGAKHEPLNSKLADVIEGEFSLYPDPLRHAPISEDSDTTTTLYLPDSNQSNLEPTEIVESENTPKSRYGGVIPNANASPPIANVDANGIRRDLLDLLPGKDSQIADHRTPRVDNREANVLNQSIKNIEVKPSFKGANLKSKLDALVDQTFFSQSPPLENGSFSSQPTKLVKEVMERGVLNGKDVGDIARDTLQRNAKGLWSDGVESIWRSMYRSDSELTPFQKWKRNQNLDIMRMLRGGVGWTKGHDRQSKNIAEGIDEIVKPQPND